MRALTVLSVPVSVDFTDLLISTVELLEESESDELAGPLVRHVRQNIQHVVVDEYQDTNHIQEPLIRALTRLVPTSVSSSAATRPSTSGAAAQ